MQNNLRLGKLYYNNKKKKTMQSEKYIKCNSNQRKYIGTPNHIYGMVERATKYIN